MKRFLVSVSVVIAFVASSFLGFGVSAETMMEDADEGSSPVFTARSTGQMVMLEREACRFVGMENPRRLWVRSGDVVRLDCRELKASGYFLSPSDVSDERRVIVHSKALVRTINAFVHNPRYSIWVSTLSGWWTPDRQGDLYQALVVQVLEGNDTPYQQIYSEAQRLIVAQEALLINPDSRYTQLWEGMSQCGYKTPGFMVLLWKEEDYPALEALLKMFARESDVPGVYVLGCDNSGLYNFVHPEEGTS